MNSDAGRALIEALGAGGRYDVGRELAAATAGEALAMLPRGLGDGGV